MKKNIEQLYPTPDQRPAIVIQLAVCAHSLIRYTLIAALSAAGPPSRTPVNSKFFGVTFFLTFP